MTNSNDPVSAPAPANPDVDPDIVARTEHIVQTYESMAEWIRFADAKAAVVVTVNGALGGVLIPTLSDYLEGLPAGPLTALSLSVIGCFIVWILLATISCACAFRCILPYRKKGSHPSLDRCSHFHPAAISHRYEIHQFTEFRKGFHDLGAQGFFDEVLAGMLIDSHISARKYAMVTTSIRTLAIATAFAFAYLIAAQF